MTWPPGSSLHPASSARASASAISSPWSGGLPSGASVTGDGYAPVSAQRHASAVRPSAPCSPRLRAKTFHTRPGGCMIASGNWLSSSTMPTARTITPGVPTASPTDAAPWCGVNQERRHPLLAHVSGGVPRWKPLCMPGFPGRPRALPSPRDPPGRPPRWLLGSVGHGSGSAGRRPPTAARVVRVGRRAGTSAAPRGGRGRPTRARGMRPRHRRRTRGCRGSSRSSAGPCGRCRGCEGPAQGSHRSQFRESGRVPPLAPERHAERVVGHLHFFAHPMT